MLVLQLALIIVADFVLPADTGRASLLLGVADLAAAVLIPCFVIMKIFKTRFLQSLQAWLPTLVAPAVTIACIFLFLRPFLFEAFSTPLNSMAPTLLGKHWQGACVKCGKPAFCSPAPDDYEPPEAPLMICRDNFHVTQPTDHGDRVFSGDRFLVAKFLEPQRWDIVLFRFPGDPSVLFVKRLVGLPGESIEIKDGHIWANGEKLTPPESVEGIKYLSEMPDWDVELWGSPNRPAKLAEDEYFVLGDFSARSRDSRFWISGAPDHNPFAVPKSHLHGVVTQIYWPLSRWRVFR